MQKVLSIILLFFLGLTTYAQEGVYMTLDKSGVYTIPCEVNGLKLRFVFDTGAADVSLSLVEAAFMLKNGYINADDFIGTNTYSLADGSLEDNMVVNLRQIKIGSKTLYNVKACISSKIKASLLFGQSAIQKLGKYSVEGNVLTLYPSSMSDKNSYSTTISSSVATSTGSKQFTDGYYIGEFRNDNRYGQGTQTYNDGKVYQGSWENDKWEGKGTITYKTGEKFVGNFHEGKRHGHGIYYDKKGKPTENDWEYGQVKIQADNNHQSTPTPSKPYYYTAYTISNVNMYDKGTADAKVIKRLSRGSILLHKVPAGVLAYEIICKKGSVYVTDIESGQSGYVFAKYLDGVHQIEVDENGSLQVVGETYTTYSDIKVKNNSNKQFSLYIGSYKYVLKPYESKTITNIPAGTYDTYAIAPGVIPYIARDHIQSGKVYSWSFSVKSEIRKK